MKANKTSFYLITAYRKKLTNRQTNKQKRTNSLIAQQPWILFLFFAFSNFKLILIPKQTKNTFNNVVGR